MQKKAIIYTMVYGAVSGVIYALALWGYELVMTVKAHVAYAWLPVVIGLLSSVIVCTAAALLTHLSQKALLGLVFWVLAAIAISQLLVNIPMRIVPRLMILFEPGLRSHLPAYPYTDTLKFWAGTDAVWLAIFFGILGLLQNTLVEGAVPAYRPAGRLAPYFVMVPVMVIASFMSGNLVNVQIREPLIVMNDLVQFAVDHQNTPVDPEVARQAHLSTLDTVADLIDRPRRLFLGTYDESFGQVTVLVDFDGDWVECTTVYGNPVFCKLQTQ